MIDDIFKKAMDGTGPEADFAVRSNLRSPSQELTAVFDASGAIVPPLNPLLLVRVASLSNCLRQNIDAIVQNVHGTGHMFEPTIDLDSDESWDRIKSAMIMELERNAEIEALSSDEDAKGIDEPEDSVVDERIKSLKEQQRRELNKLKTFFDFAFQDCSFIRGRRRMGVNEETTGYGALEVLRDARGEPRRLVNALSWTIRALPKDDPIKVKSQVRITDISWVEIEESRSFRRFVQVYDARKTYFKEYGDPRVMSAATGDFFKDEKALIAQEGDNAVKATEILWFQLDTAETDVYGLVRWGGNLLSAVGSREKEEVDLLFFENKAIPPMVVLVSGGSLAADAKEELKQIVRDQIKGKENFHKILFIEAQSASTAGALSGQPGQGNVRVEMKPLTDAIFKDQIWPTYDESNRNKIGESFRLPPIFRGITKDFNRATAMVAMIIAEGQVFKPERDDFDFEINRTIVANLGVTLWKFVSKSPKMEDNLETLKVLPKLSESILSPNDSRRIVASLLGVDLETFEGDWSKVPLRFGLAGFTVSDEDSSDRESEDDSDDDDEKVIKIAVPKERWDRLVQTD